MSPFCPPPSKEKPSYLSTIQCEFLGAFFQLWLILPKFLTTMPLSQRLNFAKHYPTVLWQLAANQGILFALIVIDWYESWPMTGSLGTKGGRSVPLKLKPPLIVTSPLHLRSTIALMSLLPKHNKRARPAFATQARRKVEPGLARGLRDAFWNSQVLLVKFHNFCNKVAVAQLIECSAWIPKDPVSTPGHG